MIASDAPNAKTADLSVSVVVYRPNTELLDRTLSSLAAAHAELCLGRPGSKLALCVIDNGGLPDLTTAVGTLNEQGIGCEIVSGQGNIGYGRGHNLAIDRAASRYHLVLNPDIDVGPDAFVKALDFFERHPQAGLITPRIDDSEGHLQYLCRRYPTLLDLFVRGFLPGNVRRLFAKRLARYEMRDLINERDVLWDPPIVSGCFMLFRTDVLKQLNGFDPRYFLYFEDYDLSLRTRELSRIAYAPMVRVLHHGGGAARKGSAHVRMFAWSAFKFYNRFGWKWL